MPRSTTLTKHRKPKDNTRLPSLKQLEGMLAKLSAGPSSKPTRVVRTILGANRNGQNGVTGSYALYFQLNDLYDVTELTSLYDNYRFVKIEVQFLSLTNAIPSATTAPLCMLLAATDLDDSTTPTLSSISQYENVKVAGGHQSLHFSFEPRFTAAGEAGGGTYLIGLQNPGQLLDCAFPNVVHRGIKYFITASAASAIPCWQIVIRYHIDFYRQR